MRKLAVAVALASTALASPALARDNSWYVGVGGGVMLVEDMDLDIGSIDNAGTVEHVKGYDFEGTVGYDFGAFRAEVEVGYRDTAIKEGRSVAPGFPSQDNGTGGCVGPKPLTGDSRATRFMVHGFVYFGDVDRLQGYVFVGARLRPA